MEITLDENELKFTDLFDNYGEETEQKEFWNDLSIGKEEI